MEYIKNIIQEKLNHNRELTKTEAIIDLKLNTNLIGNFTYKQFMIRWHWNRSKCCRFINELHNKNYLKKTKAKNHSSTLELKVKRPKEKKEKDFIDKIVELFLHKYKEIRNIDYEILNYLNERNNAAKLLHFLKKKQPKFDDQQMLEGIEVLFHNCLLIQEKYHYDKMSIYHIRNTFNTLRNIISKNKERNETKSDTEEIGRIVNEATKK